MTTRAILSTTLAATILSLASAALPGVEPEFRELAANDAARAPAEALASSLHPGFTTEKVCQRRGAETSIGIVHVEMHGPGATTGTSLMVKVVDGKGTLLQELPAYKGMTFDPKDAGKAQRIIDCYEACAAFSPGKGMPVLQKLVSVTMGGLSQVAIGGEAAGCFHQYTLDVVALDADNEYWDYYVFADLADTDPVRVVGLWKRLLIH